MGYFCNFRKTAQSKQSPNGRKFAQSGHPASEMEKKMAAIFIFFSSDL
jgi:hypothetical protein